MNILHIFRRYNIVIIFTILIFGGLGGYYSVSNNSQKFISTMFLTVATQNSSNPEQAEVASTYFGETLVGWFRNPVFLASIKENNQSEIITISAYKQERQNIIIEIQTHSKSSAINIAENVFENIILELTRYNSVSNNDFVIVDQGRTIRESQTALLFYPLAGVLLGLFLSFFFFIIKEFFNNEISSIEDAEEILNTKTLDFLSKKFEKNDYTLLSTALQQGSQLIIIAGVSTNIEMLSIALSHNQGELGKNITLVDGDLHEKNLHNPLGVSSRIKNLKGHTDACIKDEKMIDESLILQNTTHDNIKFVFAGKGSSFFTKVFINLSNNMQTIIHTHFPKNYSILQLDTALLMLVVEIGKTKARDLKRIRQLWNGKIELIIVE
jgi:hypothetical protein